MYYRTVNIPDQMAIDLSVRNKSQQDRVFELFCEKKIPMSWSEVSGFLPDLNEVSLKRCLSDLSNEQRFEPGDWMLKKTKDKVLSKHRHPCYRYCLTKKSI